MLSDDPIPVVKETRDGRSRMAAKEGFVEEENV